MNRKHKKRIEQLESENKDLKELFKSIGTDLVVSNNLTEDSYKDVVELTISAITLLPYSPNDIKLLKVIIDRLNKHKDSLERLQK